MTSSLLELLIAAKIYVPFIGFMVLKTTGLSSRFQHKNWFWKIYIGSRDIRQNMSKFEGLVWFVKFWHIYVNIFWSNAYFSKPIFALKPWAQAGRFEYNEPYNRKTFFFTLIRGSWNFQRICGGSKKFWNWKILSPLFHLLMSQIFPKERNFSSKNELLTLPYCSIG